MKNLIPKYRSLLINLVGKAVAATSTIIVIPLFTSKLEKEIFAQITILWLMSPIIQRLTSGGSDAVIAMRFFKNSAAQNSETIWTSIHSFITLSLISYPILVIYSCYSTIFNISWIDWGLFLFTTLTSNMCSLLANTKRMEQQPQFSVVVEALRPLLIAIATFVVFQAGNTSLSGYLEGMAIGSAPLFIATIIWAHNHPSSRFKLNSVWRHCLTGAPALPSSISAMIFMMGDRYIIEFFLGLENLADYALGFRLAEFALVSIFVPFSQTINVEILRIAKSSLRQAVIYTIHSTRTFFLAITIITFIAWEFSEKLILLTGDTSYNDADWVFRSTLGTISLYYLVNAINGIFYHLERPWIPTICGLFGAISSITLNIWLVPKLGLIGAIYTGLIANTIVMCLQCVSYSKLAQISISEIIVIYFPWLLLGCITVYLGTLEQLPRAVPRIAITSTFILAVMTHPKYIGISTTHRTPTPQ